MGSSDRTERDRLLRRSVLAGDEHAWRVWFDESFDDLYAYVRWRCGGCRDQTDEVVQQAWFTAVRSVRKYDPAKASFATWLKGIATNVLRNELRQKMRINRSRETIAVETLADGSGDVIEIARRHEYRSKRIAHTLNRLPDHYDEILRAKYMENLSVAEIAAMRGESPKTVESILWRARRLFRKTYKNEEES